jgi:hypothetical protein
MLAHTERKQTVNREDLKKHVDKAISQLLEKDSYLLIHDVNERSISHRLAMYLTDEFPDHDVDCEYNRNRGEPKRLDLLLSYIRKRTVPITDTKARTAYPDIIVHRRGSNVENLLVIEIKKTSTVHGEKFDLAKLDSFRKDPYNYNYALYLCLQTGHAEAKVGDYRLFP